MGLCSLQKCEDLRRGLEDVGEGELVGDKRIEMHLLVEIESSFAGGWPLLSVGGDDGSPVVDTGGRVVVENEASVIDVGGTQSGDAKTEEFEREEGKVGLAKGNEKGMELVEVREVGASLTKPRHSGLALQLWRRCS
ncbi:hypothetical protein AMTR_s00095p00123990 [Amborella trichopoda]|uniref:Uncharacterized protein n=1 Tax=Amborella trichopoda TaxID=13333 RepID=W1NP56_AMBTC|nr:hypothetical protein AMTR_s00095p00123990 [Amborella trichopoda]